MKVPKSEHCPISDYALRSKAQGPTSVATSPEAVEFLVLLGREFAILHISEVVLDAMCECRRCMLRSLLRLSHLALHFILVYVLEVVFRKP